MYIVFFCELKGHNHLEAKTENNLETSKEQIQVEFAKQVTETGRKTNKEHPIGKIKSCKNIY